MRRILLSFVCLGTASLAGAWFAGPLLHGQTPAPLVIPIPRELSSYRDVVRNVLPAVVSIETTSKQVTRAKQSQPKRQPKTDDLPIPPEFRKFFEERQFQPFEFPDDLPHRGLGSGF